MVVIMVKESLIIEWQSMKNGRISPSTPLGVITGRGLDSYPLFPPAAGENEAFDTLYKRVYNSPYRKYE
jgi:hypothetical protein